MLQNRVSRTLIAVLLALCGILRSAAQDGSLDLTFNSTDVGYASGDGLSGGASPTVNVAAIQPDGKIIVTGYFTKFNNIARAYALRLTSGGVLDASYNPGTGANNQILTSCLQPDGKIIFGGWFTTYGGSSRNRVVRVNADGTLDANFNPGTGANNVIRASALQPDGKIIIGGAFTSYSGTPRNRIARLNADGSLDPSFAPGIGADSTIYSVAIQADGKIIIGGLFSSCNGTVRNRIARLNADGSLDASFNPGTGTSGASNRVYGTAALPNGKIFIAGDFTSYNGTSRNRVVRVNADGTLDVSFNPGSGASSDILTMLALPDGKIALGGEYFSYNGTPCGFIARVNADGSLDTGFSGLVAGLNSFIRAIAVQPDGKFIVGGDFDVLGSQWTGHIGRLNTNGSVDGSFNPKGGADGWVVATAIQPGGKTILAGSFYSYNGTSRKFIARANTDGSVDPTFNPGTGPNNTVWTTAIQPDGKIIIGGYFTSVNGTTSRYIARLNIDGMLDAGFNPGQLLQGVQTYSGRVETCAIQADGKILVGGLFTTNSNGVTRNTIVRLNADGSLDEGFSMAGLQPNNYVNTISVQTDGKILVGGNIAGEDFVRLNADGSLDTGFDLPPGVIFSGVTASAIQTDGKILVTGYEPDDPLIRLNSDGSLDPGFEAGTIGTNTIRRIIPLPDGKIMTAGDLYLGSQWVGIISRNADGSLDTGFDQGTGISGEYNGLYGLAIQSDGKIIIGGDFTSYNGIGRNRIARINGTPRTGIKLLLEGPYSGTTMNDALRDLPSFPLTEPFTAMGYSETGYVPGATIGSAVLTTTGNNAIVDWVLVEMRPASTPGTVAAARALLLQRDGDVVDLDGVSTVGFAGLAAGNYCVAVKPRNHLPVMLSATTPVSYGAAIATVDFTLPSTLISDNDARKNVSGVMVLLAGDVTFNETVSYTGAGNDRDPILTRVGSTTPNATVAGYWREDVNMDGAVKYTGSANDRDITLTNVGSTTPNNTRVATLP